MVNPVAINPEPRTTSDSNTSGGQKTIDKSVTGEIVIALCGPMGVPLHEVAETFQHHLKHSYGYETVDIIRLSQEIRNLSELADENISRNDLIEAGNNLRKLHGNSVLAATAIRKIRLARGVPNTEDAQVNLFDTTAVTPTNVVQYCHIIDSIKNIEELRLLRSVYGDMLHVVGVYAPIELRIARLEKQKSPNDEIHKLIDRDSGEEIEHGQNVAEIFPMSDFFLRADHDTNSELHDSVKRFLDIMLGTRIATPTPLERSMYAAYSAARNSACLSRQVGAAITDIDGQVIATGWNDVPKPFGGLYESMEPAGNDHRCWNKEGGKCFNDEEKDIISSTLIDLLVEKKIIDEKNKKSAVDIIRKNSKLKGLIEFSRAVHAEMHALLNAGSANGAKIRGAKMFVTTYPCHSCARHIIAAGIKEIYFIQPYRKSLATKLHSDAITEAETDKEKVRLVPFHGVAPARYLQFFSAPQQGRKNSSTGKIRPREPFPVTARNLEAVQTLELLAIKPVHFKEKQ